jgi:GNAT superfamily N-acetyltransferase
MEIRRGRLDEIIDLRHAVLRQGLPRDAAVFEGDSGPAARHYVATADNQIIGCTTLHPSRSENEPAWQLRGMAVADGHRGRGVGRLMLQFMEQELVTDPSAPLLLWCNARVPASGFYQRLGWEVVSNQFEIPTAGPHFRMVKRLTRED